MPDQVPEINNGGEIKTTQTKPESMTTAEAPAVQEINPVVEQHPTHPVVQIPDNNASQPQDDQTAQAADPDDLKQEEQKDKSWVQKANAVIKEYEDKPYKEEEASEELQHDYLKRRFNINVSDEEKN